MYLYEPEFSSQTSSKITYYNRSSGDTDMKIQLFSIKLDIKEICMTEKQYHLANLLFVFKNWLFFMNYSSYISEISL